MFDVKTRIKSIIDLLFHVACDYHVSHASRRCGLRPDERCLECWAALHVRKSMPLAFLSAELSHSVTCARLLGPAFPTIRINERGVWCLLPVEINAVPIHTQSAAATTLMMMPFICSCRNNK
jgi:hypothetical protein